MRSTLLLEKGIDPLLDRYAGDFCEYLMVTIATQGPIKDFWLSWVRTGKQPSKSESGKCPAEHLTAKVTSQLHNCGLKV
jgi:hypothetical protein